MSLPWLSITALVRQNDTESVATLERALERGVTFFDTADMYGSGSNEELIGSEGIEQVLVGLAALQRDGALPFDRGQLGDVAEWLAVDLLIVDLDFE